MKIEVKWERGEKETCFKNMWFLRTTYYNHSIALVEKVEDGKYRIERGKGYKYFNSLDDAKSAIERRYLQIQRN